MLYVPANNFSVISGHFLSSWYKSVLSMDKVSHSRTQHSLRIVILHHVFVPRASFYLQASHLDICLIDSLRPINNRSVIKGRVFLGWTSAKLGLMFLLKDTMQWRRWGSNPRPLCLESSTLPLRYCTPSSWYGTRDDPKVLILAWYLCQGSHRNSKT